MDEARHSREKRGAGATRQICWPWLCAAALALAWMGAQGTAAVDLPHKERLKAFADARQQDVSLGFTEHAIMCEIQL